MVKGDPAEHLRGKGSQKWLNKSIFEAFDIAEFK
jgi:hypothetical protein